MVLDAIESDIGLAAWEADRAMLANQSIQRSAPLLWHMQKPCLLDETVQQG